MIEKLSEEFKLLMMARGIIEDVEIPKVWNIVGGVDRVVVGRTNANRILKALKDTGFTLMRKRPETEAYLVDVPDQGQ